MSFTGRILGFPLRYACAGAMGFNVAGFLVLLTFSTHNGRARRASTPT